MARFGCIGLHGKQTIEAWHEVYKQNAACFTADTESQSCEALVASTALENRESHAISRLGPPIRKRARLAVRQPNPGRKRLSVNKHGLCHVEVTIEKAEAEREAGVRAQFAEAERTVQIYIRTTQRVRTYPAQRSASQRSQLTANEDFKASASRVHQAWRGVRTASEFRITESQTLSPSPRVGPVPRHSR